MIIPRQPLCHTKQTQSITSSQTSHPQGSRLFYWLLTRFSNSFSTWGTWNRAQYLSFSLTSIVFPLIALLLAFHVCNESWLLACIQPDKQFDLPIYLSKAVVQLVLSQAPQAPRSAIFHFARFLRLAYASSLWRCIWVKSLFEESTTLPCLVVSTNFLGIHFVFCSRCWWRYCVILAPVSAFVVVLTCYQLDAEPSITALQVQQSGLWPFSLTGHFSNPPMGNWISPNH